MNALIYKIGLASTLTVMAVVSPLWAEDTEAGRGEPGQGYHRGEKWAELQKLKNEDPEKFQSLMKERKAKLKEKMEKLKTEDPQKYEQVKKEMVERRRKKLEKMREENPEKFKEMMQQKKQKLLEMKEKNPEKYQEFLKNHPRAAERLERGESPWKGDGKHRGSHRREWKKDGKSWGSGNAGDSNEKHE